MAEFSGVSGSVLYNEFARGDHRYVLLQFTRADGPDPLPVGPLLDDEQRALARATSTIAVDALSTRPGGG